MNQVQIAQTIQQHLAKYDRQYITLSEFQKIFPDLKYPKITLGRLVKSGLIERLTKGIYIVTHTPINLDKVATQVYAPAYISLQTALARHGVINQGTYVLTLVTTKRNKTLQINKTNFIYHHIQPKLFFGYLNQNGSLIATKEKAVLDTLYFISYGKLNLDISEWYLDKINKSRLKQYLNKLPPDAKERLMPKLSQYQLV